ncbi:MAG: hypothetical protein HQL82_14325 [Magnetococcales bacterium]|nr:hypothetical protein [Magnetococcales bacterium]
MSTDSSTSSAREALLRQALPHWVLYRWAALANLTAFVLLELSARQIRIIFHREILDFSQLLNSPPPLVVPLGAKALFGATVLWVVLALWLSLRSWWRREFTRLQLTPSRLLLRLGPRGRIVQSLALADIHSVTVDDTSARGRLDRGTLMVTGADGRRLVFPDIEGVRAMAVAIQVARGAHGDGPAVS